MSGILYGRVPGVEPTDEPIHLWQRDGDTLTTACGDQQCDIVDQSASSYLIERDGTKKEIRVEQKESFQQATSGYCDACLEAHHKVE